MINVMIHPVPRLARYTLNTLTALCIPLGLWLLAQAALFSLGPIPADSMGYSQSDLLREQVLPRALPAVACLAFALVRMLLWCHFEWRRQERLSNRHCPHCDYDLRATPTRCPECGTPVTPPTHPSTTTAIP